MLIKQKETIKPLIAFRIAIKVCLSIIIFAFSIFPANGQDYQIKFFAYPKNYSVFKPSGKGEYENSPHEHLYVLFEKRQTYEGCYGFSPDKVIGNFYWPYGGNYNAQFFNLPLAAYAYSMREETYKRLKPDSVMSYFSTLRECMVFANKILNELGKNTPTLTDSTITSVDYVRAIIRLNTPNYQPFTDERDGKIYNTVKIGNQIWMAENLNYQPDSTYTFHPKSEIYGRLYDHKTAMNACPCGWHLSTKAEWDTLIAYAGGTDRASLNLKAKDFWIYPMNYPESIAKDSLGFRILPAGLPPVFENGHTFFWTATEKYPKWVWFVTLTSYHKEVILKTTIAGENLEKGYSVRCVKNN